MRHLSVVFFFVLLPALIFPQDKNSSAPSMEEMMKKMAELSTPGAMHKKLDFMTGSWNVKSSYWMMPGDQTPTTTSGSAEFKWMLGGRFLMEDYKGEFMGKPMTGMGINGYDNLRKKYSGVWIDDMGTVISTMDGNFDQSGKILTLYGKWDEPTTGEFDKNVAYVTKLVNDDKFIFEIHDLSIGGKDTKIAEMEYTRKK